MFELEIPDSTTIAFRVERTAESGLDPSGVTVKVSSRASGTEQTLVQTSLVAKTPVALGPVALPAPADALVFEVTSEGPDGDRINAVFWSDVLLETRTSQPLRDARWAEPVADSVARFLAEAYWPDLRAGKRRMLVVGIDGASWPLLDRLISEGQLPVLAALKRRGRFGNLRSTVIPESAKAWTTIRTGVGPGKHGVFHFLSHAVPRSSYWRWLSPAKLTSIIVGVPRSTPRELFRGILVGGWDLTAKRPYTQPGSLKRYLARSHYQPGQVAYRNVDYFQARMSERTDLVLALLRGMDWDDAFAVYEYSDTAAHRFGLESAEWRRTYAFIDTQIGRLLEATDDETTLLLISDHGWRHYEGSVVLNPWLQENGFPQWSTHIYAGNRVGLFREPAVDHAREAMEIAKLTEALQGLVDPTTGEPLVERVIPAADAFPGPLAGTAHCRAVVQLVENYRIARSSDQRAIVSHEPTAQHDMDGFYLLVGPGITPGEGRPGTVYDVAPTVAGYFGVTPPIDIEGEALWDFGVPTRAVAGTAADAGLAAQVDDGTVLTPDDEPVSEELRQTLRALGYIDE